MTDIFRLMGRAPMRRPLPSTLSTSTTPGLPEGANPGSVSASSGASLRHRYSVASTSSTLYTYDEEDEDEPEAGPSGSSAGHGSEPAEDQQACLEVIQDTRLNSGGFGSWPADASTNRSRREGDKATNHAMRFKRRQKPARASLVTLGEEWHPRHASVSTSSEAETSSSPVVSPRKSRPPSRTALACTCQVQVDEDEGLPDESVDEVDDEELGIDQEDQLDRMIQMTNDLLRISKNVLASSTRISVAEASISQIQHSQEYALRQHLEALETQDRFMHLMSSDAHAILNSASGLDHEYTSPFSTSSPLASPPAQHARGRLRPHSSSGSISAAPVRATTMYVNAEMGGPLDALGTGAERRRHASVGSHVTASSGLMSVEEEPDAALHDREASTSSARGVAATTAQVSRQPPTASSRLLYVASSSTPAQTAAGDKSLVSPALSAATSTSTPSTFFSSFWSRSSASSAATAASSPNDTSFASSSASPSPSNHLMAGKTGSTAAASQKKDARSMLSALALASPSPSVSSNTASVDTSPSATPPLAGTVDQFATYADVPSASAAPVALASMSHDRRHSESPAPSSMASPPTIAALAQLSAIHSSPHLTISSRPRHRSSLSESLLRASRSNSSLMSDKSSAAGTLSPTPSHADLRGQHGHRRIRHSTSPAGRVLVQTSDVPISLRRER